MATEYSTIMDADPSRSGAVPSLAATAEKMLLKELATQVQSAVDQSIFGIGGSIPIVSPLKGAICEADEAFAHSSDDEHGSRPNFEVPNEGTRMEAVVESDAHSMRCDPVTIRWDGKSDPSISHKLTLPCSDASRPAFEQLLKDCQPASFGRGGKDIMDETYRKAGKIDESAFCTNFNPYSLGIIDTVAQTLTPNNPSHTNTSHGLRAELYKLNVYSSPSGMFKAHVDTPRSKSQIGSLVICLPSVHEGGGLILRHQGKEMVFDWSGPKGQNTIQWAAFYSDCEHEVLEVTSGHRVTLTYNLYTTCWVNTVWTDPDQLELHNTLMRSLQEPGFCKDGLTLGYHCSHAYPHSEKSTIETLPAMLKGVDKLVYECFLATFLPTKLRHVLDYDLADVGWHMDNFVKDKRVRGGKNKSENPWKLLEEVYDKTDHGRWSSYSPRKDWSKDDLFLMSEQLVKWSWTEEGLYEECDMAELLRKWTEDFKVHRVKWLNEKSHSEMALLHGTYGNEAGMNAMYCGMVITLEIPPFQER